MDRCSRWFYSGDALAYEIALFFDGAKDLFRFLLSPQRSCADPELVPIAGIFVTSFYDRAPIDARNSFFVVGSDVLGPGGGDLVAHRSVGEARAFSQNHRGGRVIGFETVNADLLDSALGGET